MVEKIVLDYLNEALSVPVYMEEKTDMPEEYVLIEKTGGGEENHIERATVVVQSYASSMYRAAVINESVKEKMKQSIQVDDICKCSLNSDYNYTDASRKKYRYQAVFDIVHY